ncbi:hypothetical protein ANN_19377 [Periplaneta americana]|uniref:Uncharacterized protein n=1 Tax=Periplaneta americana TaxID=6978 RepID=A0ABQ8SA77_PERAM|nr:hypothetical protein ANN_19377 [Periplaneta americana]
MNEEKLYHWRKIPGYDKELFLASIGSFPLGIPINTLHGYAISSVRARPAAEWKNMVQFQTEARDFSLHYSFTIYVKRAISTKLCI